MLVVSGTRIKIVVQIGKKWLSYNPKTICPYLAYASNLIDFGP